MYTVPLYPQHKVYTASASHAIVDAQPAPATAITLDCRHFSARYLAALATDLIAALATYGCCLFLARLANQQVELQELYVRMWCGTLINWSAP